MLLTKMQVWNCLNANQRLSKVSQKVAVFFCVSLVFLYFSFFVICKYLSKVCTKICICKKNKCDL